MSRQTKPFSENVKLARIVLIAVVVFSILVFSPVKLNGLRNDALDVFRNGTEEGITVSMYTDLISAADNANRLANLAVKELGEDDEDVMALKQRAAAIKETDDPGKMLTAFSGISIAADNAYSRLSDAAKADAKGAYANISDMVATIKRDGYTAVANDFNRTRNAFPAVLFSGLFGIDELPTGGK